MNSLSHHRLLLLFGPMLFSGTALVATPRCSAGAQETGTIRGNVMEAGTGRVLPEVSITVRETGFEVRTGKDGEFTLADVPVGEAHLALELSRYAGTIEQVVVSPVGVTEVSFELKPVAILLDELVVSGQIRLSEEAVTVFPREGAQGGEPAATAADILAREFPGLEVRRASGNALGRSSVRMRGVTSFAFSGDPVIYLDGIRVEGASERAEGYGGWLAWSVLDMIPAESIERIEVLKGPAAAGLYVAEANNGVIRVWTKKGKGSGGSW
ncbi:MAG: TonB-dependent receptor plug domain-containing protein [Gemmatimonadota bacterium]